MQHLYFDARRGNRESIYSVLRANDDVASGVSTYCVLNHRDVHFEPLLWKGGRRVRQQELLDFEQEVSLKIRELQPQLFSGADAEVLSLVRSRLA